MPSTKVLLIFWGRDSMLFRNSEHAYTNGHDYDEARKMQCLEKKTTTLRQGRLCWSWRPRHTPMAMTTMNVKGRMEKTYSHVAADEEYKAYICQWSWLYINVKINWRWCNTEKRQKLSDALDKEYLWSFGIERASSFGTQSTLTTKKRKC